MRALVACLLATVLVCSAGVALAEEEYDFRFVPDPIYHCWSFDEYPYEHIYPVTVTIQYNGPLDTCGIHFWLDYEDGVHIDTDDVKQGDSWKNESIDVTATNHDWGGTNDLCTEIGLLDQTGKGLEASPGQEAWKDICTFTVWFDYWSFNNPTDFDAYTLQPTWNCKGDPTENYAFGETVSALVDTCDWPE